MNDGERREVADERQLHQKESIDRIVDFSNGVMGFAITLLVVDLRVPILPNEEASLPGEILDLWPQFLAYVISFYVIGDNWIIYNRIFSHIERFDERLYWLSLLFLFFVVILPFPTRLVSSYPDRKLPVLLYLGVIICVNFARTLLWWYASSGHRLVHENLDTRFVRRTLLMNVLILGGFLLSAVIALFSPIEAVYLWILLGIAGVVTRLVLYRIQ